MPTYKTAVIERPGGKLRQMLTIVNILPRNSEMLPLPRRDIGAMVRQAKTAAGLTQGALGTRIGASRFWAADFERGKPLAELGLALRAPMSRHLPHTTRREQRVVVPAPDLPHGHRRHLGACGIERTIRFL